MSLSDLNVLERESAIERLQDEIIAQADGKRTVNDIITIISTKHGALRTDVSYALVRATDSRIEIKDDVVTAI
jgi:hypothetical protein